MFKCLKVTGVGLLTNSTEELSCKDKENLWLSSVLDLDLPRVYFVLHFYCGECFCLLGLSGSSDS